MCVFGSEVFKNVILKQLYIKIIFLNFKKQLTYQNY
jgi:hypothetical protein